VDTEDTGQGVRFRSASVKKGGNSMQEETEKKSALTADDLEKLDPRYWEQDFWLGYRRGLNRRLYGEIFGNAEVHRSWHDIPDNLEKEPHIERVASGIGYRIGYAGTPIEEAAEELKKFIKSLKEKYGIEEMQKR
jgi:hypothetical protein